MCVGSRSKVDEQKLHNLEAEVLELRTALKEVKHRNLLLEEQLEQARCVNANCVPKFYTYNILHGYKLSDIITVTVMGMNALIKSFAVMQASNS